jgi:hypothetical protein
MIRKAGLSMPKLISDRPAITSKGGDYACNSAGYGQEAGFEQEHGPYAAPLYTHGPHGAYLADALEHDHAEGVGYAHHDDDEQHHQDHRCRAVQGHDYLLNLGQELVYVEQAVLHAFPFFLGLLPEHGLELGSGAVFILGSALEDLHRAGQVLVDRSRRLVGEPEALQHYAHGLVFLRCQAQEFVGVAQMGIRGHLSQDAGVKTDACKGKLAYIVLAGHRLHLHQEPVADLYIQPGCDLLGQDKAVRIIHGFPGAVLQEQSFTQEGLPLKVSAGHGGAYLLAFEDQGSHELRTPGYVLHRGSGGCHRGAQGPVVPDHRQFLVALRFLGAAYEYVPCGQMGEILCHIGREGPGKAVYQGYYHDAEGYGASEQQTAFLLPAQVAQGYGCYRFHGTSYSVCMACTGCMRRATLTG